jgi:hypothetical protein
MSQLLAASWPAHRPQTAVPDMGLGAERPPPLAGRTSHRPFRRHNHAGASLTDAVASTLLCLPALVIPDESRQLDPHTRQSSLFTVTALFRRLKYLSTSTRLGC